MQKPVPDGVKLRIINRYRGEESNLFGGGAVPEGAKVIVTPPRARALISMGVAVPIVGPSETKPVGPVEKKASGGTGGSTVPPSSLQAAPASRQPTAQKSLADKALQAGVSLLSRTTSAASRRRTSSTAATRTTGTHDTRTGGSTSTK